MAVRLRMKRLGRRHRPFYRICAMDSRVPRDGRAIEELGHYDPMVPDKSQRVQLNMDRVDYWLSVGAQPTEKVGVLIKKAKLNKFGEAAAPPPMTPPKEKPETEETTSEESAGEESAGETSQTEEAEAEQEA